MPVLLVVALLPAVAVVPLAPVRMEPLAALVLWHAADLVSLLALTVSLAEQRPVALAVSLLAHQRAVVVLAVPPRCVAVPDCLLALW